VADTPGDLLVVEISHRGKLITGDPFFTPGTPVVLEKKGSNEALPGDLAVVRVGKGRAHLVEVLGDAANVEAVICSSRRASWARARRGST
jgi:hypothetical protein